MDKGPSQTYITFINNHPRCSPCSQTVPLEFLDAKTPVVTRADAYSVLLGLGQPVTSVINKTSANQ